MVLDYRLNDYTAYQIDDVIRAKGNKGAITTSTPLATFLDQNFIECLIGDLDLHYDPRKRLLSWRSVTGEIIATKFAVKHKISIKVEPPVRYQHKGRYRAIDSSEVHKFRMDFAVEDLLSLKSGYHQKDIDVARKQLAQIYHSDANVGLDESLQEILKMRMQEFNRARDVLYEKLKK